MAQFGQPKVNEKKAFFKLLKEVGIADEIKKEYLGSVLLIATKTRKI